jgi:hypothetical protein
MAASIFAVAVFFLFNSRSFPDDARIFPLAVLGLMAVLSTAIFIRSFHRHSKAKEKPIETPFFVNAVNFWAAAISIFLYILLLPILGYFTSSAIFFISISTFLGYRDWKRLLLTVTVFLVFVYFLFIYFFERPIPPEFFQGYG